ncbi:MAG: (d)CMP kinase [Oscillospiraceae bacterium]|nr:(d)CMP kinase [Oscillospiraceae bacterium]MCL2277834.1 (d)CMP kinase [Oscillospiraceae bacterium]
MKEFKSIALDGPSGAGKSTLAKRVAKHFGFIYVDTGALYRAIGLFVFRNGVESKDEKGVLGLLSQIRLGMHYDESGLQRMLLNDEDVSDDIRLPEISTYASDVSAIPAVREFLLNMQRDMAKSHNVIMDGRDIGTVVLPSADLKIFITADDSARALRRFKELTAKGVDVTFEDVARDMMQRDKNDSEREAAPLKAADDAITVDTTELDFEQSFQALVNLISEKFGL